MALRNAFRMALATVLCMFALGVQAQVVVSQVYGGGGNSGATLRSDFIELHNNGSDTVSLDGWSVQYASSAGSSWQVTPLAGSIAPGAYYLVKQADGTGGSVDLPTPDATGTIAMSGTNGKIALSSSSAALSGSCPAGNVDFVGYGSANCFEGAGATPVLSNTTAAIRADNGCTDSNDNSADFATGAPAPRNSAAAPQPCGGGGEILLSVADASASEGAAGSTVQMLFSFALNSPAPAGGVSIQYATADGTATAGSDYVAQAGTVTIAEGATSTTIGIVVNGDDATEPDETFLVDIVGATGATVFDAQAEGTILNDDIATVAIHLIQGSGQFSPYDGQTVSTRGIVTGRKSNGFFLQTADAEADADPATSQGIYVFTSASPPESVQIGNEVIVSGNVTEYIPSADPGQFPLTEIVSPEVVFVSAGNALPAPVVLTTTFPDPAGPLDQLERVEAMRVTAASFTVVAATGGNTSEPNATGSSNGQLNLVVTGTPRPFREPGIQAPDPAPGGGGIPPIPRWDFNPELLFSDTDALGGPRYDLNVGAVLTGYVGPLDYGFRRFSVHQDPTVAPAITQGPAPSAARAPTADEVTYASYNLERFFDDVNDPAVGEPVLTTAAYQSRLAKASLGIRDFLHTPDIVGAVEVENLSTLQALASRINDDAVAAAQPNPQYVAYLLEGNDVGGIDVGFLVKTATVGATVPRVEVIGAVQQLGKDVTWNDPVNGPGTLLNDRPPLLMDAVVHFADGRSLPVTVIQVHQRSLSGAETDDAGGARTRTKRQLQADYLADQVEAMQLADPLRNITIGGDFNAFEFNDGLVDAMGTVTGLPSADDETAVAGDGADRVTEDLLNLYVEEPQDQRYSFEFDGNAQSLDHILVNQPLGATAGSLALDHARINADFPEILRGDAGTVARLADHDPAIAYFSLASADLSVQASASPAQVEVGEAMTFQATVANDGPNAAAFAGVGFAFDAELPDLAVSAPEGWNCDAPTIDAGNTTVACSAESLGDTAQAVFSLQAAAPEAEAGNAITMAASVTAQTFDPDPENNSASASIEVNADPGAGAIEIFNAVPLTGISGAAGDELLYRIEVPAGARNLRVLTYGGSGDVSLYLRHDDVPSTTEYDTRSIRPGNNETAVVAVPAAGTWYIKIVGVRAFSRVSLRGSFAP